MQNVALWTARTNLVRPIHDLHNVSTRNCVLSGEENTQWYFTLQQRVVGHSAHLVPVQCYSIACVLLLNTMALQKALLKQWQNKPKKGTRLNCTLSWMPHHKLLLARPLTHSHTTTTKIFLPNIIIPLTFPCCVSTLNSSFSSYTIMPTVWGWNVWTILWLFG